MAHRTPLNVLILGILFPNTHQNLISLKNSLAESFLSPAKCLNFLAGLLANIVLWGWVDVCSLAQQATWTVKGSCLFGLYPSAIIPGCFSIQGFGLQKLNNHFGFDNFETKPLICEEYMAISILIMSGVHYFYKFRSQLNPTLLKVELAALVLPTKKMY